MFFFSKKYVLKPPTKEMKMKMKMNDFLEEWRRTRDEVGTSPPPKNNALSAMNTAKCIGMGDKQHENREGRKN